MSLKKFVCELWGKEWDFCDPYWDTIVTCAVTGLLANPHCPGRVEKRVLKRDVPAATCAVHKPPDPPPPEPVAEDYGGQLIGMTAYSLIKYPWEEIEWFFRELVKAGGNATEALFVTTWDDTWRWQPFQIVGWEKEMWKDKDWNIGGPNYEFPIFDLTKWDGAVWAKWRKIFDLAKRLNLTLCIRVQDFCSRKDNFLERHWCFWSNIQSWRWGGPMSGGYLRWPLGEGHIWPHYDRLNAKLIAELKASGVKYYLEDWNELLWTPGSQVPIEAPADDIYENEVHRWFFENFKSHGCRADHLLASPQRGRPGSATYKTQVERLLILGAIIEHHGCASPETMREYMRLHGKGRRNFPNGDGGDQYAKGINDGRPNYTEPSLSQAVEMGRIVKANNLFGYIYKGRKFRKAQTLLAADFTAVRGLRDGFKNG